MKLQQHPRLNDLVKGYKICGVIKEKRHGMTFVWFKVENQKTGARRQWEYNVENMELMNFRKHGGIGAVDAYLTW